VKIVQVRPAVLQVTLSAYELAAVMAAARWVAEGAQGELAPGAVQQLEQVLAGYEAAIRARNAGHGADDVATRARIGSTTKRTGGDP
jgi:hypothetical protein